MKKMLINAVYPEETRVAVVEDGILVGLLLDSAVSGQLRGNIYKGRIVNVHKGLNAAFVDIGRPRHGLLPMEDINPAFVASPEPDASAHRSLRPGLDIMVQLVREEKGDKGALLTTDISIPGRFLVLLPRQETSGISRKIDDTGQRARLKGILDQIRPPEGTGLIVRTAGMDRTGAELARDLDYLLRVWKDIEDRFEGMQGPALIYSEGDVVTRALRDHLTDDTEEILVDDEDTHSRVVRFVKTFMTYKKGLVKLYRQARPLFAKYDLERQVEDALGRTVRLKGGGSIVIDTTEAMVTIDVNSGQANAASMEETALATNLEAASEIARQLALRDLGGLIAIDFIDMRHKENVRAVERALRDSLKKDRARLVVGRMSRFGIVEISRERLSPALAEKTHVLCPHCRGTGMMRSTVSSAMKALRELRLHLARSRAKRVEATLAHEVCMYILNEQRDRLARLEEEFSAKIVLGPDAALEPGRIVIGDTR